MAEVAPLTSAHHHARRAGLETSNTEWKTAAEEHMLAAKDYSRVGKNTTNTEALRILHLLEAQHRKLARIIHDKDSLATLEGSMVSRTSPAQAAPSAPKLQPEEQSRTPDAKKTSLGQVARPKSAIRESSPSLAREIASRRGIPQPVTSHISAAAQARTRQLSPESSKRNTSSPTPRIPLSILDSKAHLSKSDPISTSGDHGFASFYSNLTTGTMSTLSSALAYAGLPLSTDTQETLSVKQTRPTVKASTNPDVKKIFSKAALHAIETDHKQRGLQGPVFGPSESFYVVQRGGGTLSYADIAKAQTQSAIIGGDDEEAFVDAQEAQPPSPRQGRTIVNASRGNFGSARTGEELELENSTLKQTLEQLAARLAIFEAHAQEASMAALTQSMTTLRHPDKSADAGAEERIKLLESQIEQQADQREKLEELARKQEKKIRAYHAKWEEIKKNAREKEKTKRDRQNADDEETVTS